MITMGFVEQEVHKKRSNYIKLMNVLQFKFQHG